MGVSPNGKMTGLPSARSNAVLCSPGTGVNAIAQYTLSSYDYSGIVTDSTSGITNMSFTQTGSQTIMKWTRGINNGNSSQAQIVNGGVTNVIWAIGDTNTFGHTSFPNYMDSTNVTLVKGRDDCVVNFGSGVTASFKIKDGEISFVVTYTGPPSW